MGGTETSVVDGLDRPEHASGGAEVVLSKRLENKSTATSDRHVRTLAAGFDRGDVGRPPIIAVATIRPTCLATPITGFERLSSSAG